MLTRIVFIVVCTFISTSSLLAIPSVSWLRQYTADRTGNANSQVRSINTLDGGFLLAWESSVARPDYAINLLRTTENGEEMWYQSIVIDTFLDVSAIKALRNGSFALSASVGWPTRGVFLIVDSTGHEVVRREFDRVCNDLTPVDSTYTLITVGARYPWGSPQLSEFILRRWTYGGTLMDSFIVNDHRSATKIVQVEGQSLYAVAANSNDDNVDPAVVFVDANLTVQRQFQLRRQVYYAIHDLLPTGSLGAALVCGDYVLEVNNMGGVLWSRRLGYYPDLQIEAIERNAQSRYIVVCREGSNDEFDDGPLHAIILTYDGNLVSNTALPDLTGRDGLDVLRNSSGDNLIAAISLRSIYGNVVWLARLCPEQVDAAHPAALYSPDFERVNFSLVHETGAVDRLVFSNYSGPAWGEVSGTASATWEALANGDGNNGDSVIFTATVPLTSGTADTFALYGLTDCAHLAWTAGCRSDSIYTFHGRADIDTFYAHSWLGSVGVTLVLNAFADLDHCAVVWINDRGVSDTLLLEQSEWDPLYFGGGIYEWPWSFVNVMPILYDVAGCVMAYPGWTLSIPNINAALTPPALPAAVELLAYPNPFNSSAQIRISLSRPGALKLIIFDLLGREVRELHNGVLTAGEHSFPFDGSNLPSGIYIAQAQAGEFVTSQKLLLLK